MDDLIAFRNVIVEPLFLYKIRIAVITNNKKTPGNLYSITCHVYVSSLLSLPNALLFTLFINILVFYHGLALGD